MQILGSAELTRDVQTKDLCVDCGACVGQCPYFKSHKGKIAMLFPCTLPQGRCHAHCPKTEVDLNAVSEHIFNRPYDGSPLGYYNDIKKARAGKILNGKNNFQNGGAVSSLISYAIKSGMINAAALTQRNGLIPVPVLATSEDDVLASSSSKYMAAPTVSTINEYTGNGGDAIGIVGTPCQITAVAQMKTDPLKRDDFRDSVALSIGLLCTWALDTRKFIDLVERYTSVEDIISMDVPPPPANVLELSTTTGRIAIPLEEIRTAVPAGCGICPDMTAEFSDISVGALEGDPGWNTLIIRSEKGAALVNDAVSAGYLETGTLPQTTIDALSIAAAGKKQRAVTKAKEGNLLNTSEDAGPSALRIQDDVVEAILT